MPTDFAVSMRRCVYVSGTQGIRMVFGHAMKCD